MIAENRVGCAIGPGRTVCRPGIRYRVERGASGEDGRERERRHRMWLIDVTERIDGAKEGAVTKVDFTMAPPRIGPLDYRDGNELTTEAGSRRHDAGHYPWQILRYDVDFFFPSALLFAPFSTVYPVVSFRVSRDGTGPREWIFARQRTFVRYGC